MSGTSIPPLVARLSCVGELRDDISNRLRDKCDPEDVFAILSQWAVSPRATARTPVQIAQMTTSDVVADLIASALINPDTSPFMALCPNAKPEVCVNMCPMNKCSILFTG